MAKISLSGPLYSASIDQEENEKGANFGGIKKGLKEKIILSLTTDLSAWTLLISNLAVIFFAITENWSLITIMLVYWAQSVIIGFFNFLRILMLKDFSAAGFIINGKPAGRGAGVKIFTAFFFAFHYGFFHFIYLMFMLIGGGFVALFGNAQGMNLEYVLAAIPLFFINHLFSFISNHKRDSEKTPNIGRMMFAPYARIIPMHLTIVFGGLFFFSQFGLALFLMLKTIADLAMHASEHEN